MEIIAKITSAEGKPLNGDLVKTAASLIGAKVVDGDPEMPPGEQEFWIEVSEPHYMALVIHGETALVLEVNVYGDDDAGHDEDPVGTEPVAIFISMI